MSGGITALLKGSAILAVSNISLKAISFFLLPLYTAQLTPEQLGINDAIGNFSSLLFAILVLALDGAYSAFYYDEKSEEYRNRVFSTVWLTLAGGAFICWLAMLGSPFISELLFGTSEYQWVVCIALFGASMELISLPYALDLRIQNKMMLFSIVTVTGAGLAVALNVLFVLTLNLGVYSFILSTALTALYQVIVYRLICKKQAQISSFDSGLIKRMLRYSLPLLPSNLSFWVINALGLYVILHFYSEAEVGVYGIASRFATMLTVVTRAVMTSYTAFAFQTILEDGAEQKICRVVNAFFLLVSLICLTVSLGGRELIELMTTPDYYQAYTFLPGVMFGLLSYSMFQFFSYGVAFKKKSYFTTIATVSGAILSAVLCFALIPLLGGMGASISLLLSYSLVAVLQYVFGERVNPIGYKFKRIAIVFIIFVALSYLGLFLLSPLRLLLWAIGVVVLLVSFKDSLSDFRELIRMLLRRKPQ